MAHLSTCLPLTRESTLEAHELIKPLIHYTLAITSRALNEMASTPQAQGEKVLQPAKPIIDCGLNLIDNGGIQKGVVGFSAGNHAQVLALAARESGITAYIVMPDITRPYKNGATKGYGANVVICPRFERETTAARIVAEKGARLVPPFNHTDVILGQATAGLELQEQADHLDAIIAPCSGGGLLSGTAISCEGTPIRVFGAEPEFEGADDGRRGFLAGKRVTSVTTNTIADGLIGVVGDLPWSVIYER
ncbi:hypothetical protein ACKLNR_014580 [Fusarium oxysporum f. sp. zingiberi]